MPNNFLFFTKFPVPGHREFSLTIYFFTKSPVPGCWGFSSTMIFVIKYSSAGNLAYR
jgi:hypothetical protein